MPKEKKMDMLNLVKTRYDTTLTDDSSILSSISRKWRNYKKSLKMYWVPDTLEYKVEDSRVSKVQFLNLVHHWNKEETNKRCLKNKDARSKKKMNHYTGKKSFAEIDYDLVKKLDRKPSRAEPFESIWLKKEKIPDHIKKILAKMEEKRKALPQGVEDTIGPNDIFAQVLGPDPPGYVRMVGTGTTPSAAWGNSTTKYSSKRIILEQKSTINNLQKDVQELREIIFGQHGTSSTNHLIQPISPHDLQVGTCVDLKSVVDPSKVVAKGFIHSSDENKDIGGQILGQKIVSDLTLVF